MSKKWLTALDLQKNELQNAVVQNLGAAPGTPANGQVFYLTTGSHDLQARVNGAWVSLLPSSLLATANTWTANQTINASLLGNGTIALTGAGASSVGGTLSATAHISTGLTGATSASRYVGATASGAPASGTFVTGDFVITQNGHIFICTAGGTPGTWADVAGSGLTPATSVVATTTFGTSSVVGTSTNYARQDHAHGSPTHVGTDHSTISISSLSTPTGDVAWGSHKITSLLDGTAATDAATLGQVTNLINTGTNKSAVRAATTANITTLAGGAPNAVDGVSVAVNDRVLVKNQTTGSQNGLYIVQTVGTGVNGTWVRATDADIDAEVKGGLSVWVNEGTTNADTRWVLTTNDPITVGTTSLTFVQDFAATSVTAGAGLTASGGVIAVGAGTGISVAADTVGVDTTVVARKFTQQIGNGALTTIAVTHSLGNQWCNVQVFNTSSPFDEQECDIQLTDANTVTLLFTTAPATNALRVVVTG